MEAMVLEENPAAQARLAAALAEAGFEVTLAEDVGGAKVALRRGIHDVLILSERVGGRLAHDVALLAELRNPGLGTILVTDRAGPEVAEIFDLLPSVHAVLGRRTPARTLARLALAAARPGEGDEDEADAFPRDADPEGPEAPVLFRPARSGGTAPEAAPAWVDPAREAAGAARWGSDHRPPGHAADATLTRPSLRASGRRLHLA